MVNRSYISARDQKYIIDRAQGRCEYCHSLMEYSAQPFVFEHIIPVSRDGATDRNNLAFACGGCNGHKYNKLEGFDPIDKVVAALFNPRQQQWLSHFAWNEDYTHAIGMTSVGRATVHTLYLNRQGVVNLRKVLCLTGKHPPMLE